MIFSIAWLNPPEVNDDPDTLCTSRSLMFFPTTTSLIPLENLPWNSAEVPCAWLVSMVTPVITELASVTVTPTYCCPPGLVYLSLIHI